jgi:5-methylcytosine-specific restriction endonuclease McrBC GTP-binding regulatory subunit McrB
MFNQPAGIRNDSGKEAPDARRQQPKQRKSEHDEQRRHGGLRPGVHDDPKMPKITPGMMRIAMESGSTFP